MDEQTNKKIEELKKNPPNRVLPVLLLPLALAGVFCYRVASTDPKWEAVEPVVAPSRAPTAKPATTTPTKKAATPAPKTQAPAPKTQVVPTAQTADVEPAEVPTQQATSEAVSETPPPAPATTAASDELPPAETPSADSEALDTYLNSHLGQKVPFLYKGEKRTVTLAAFSDETVTIKRKKSFTMKRTDLSPEQLKLWR